MAQEKELTKAEVLQRVEVAKEQLDKIPTGRVKKHLGGFMEFVRKQGVVGLAVGLAVGTQASELVKNIVSSVITPVVDLLVGKEGLGGLTWTVHVSDRTSTFNFGLLIDSSIKFLAVAVVIYIVIMGLKLDKLDKKKD
jgi:large conductance mechanosensitive channel protein